MASLLSQIGYKFRTVGQAYIEIGDLLVAGEGRLHIIETSDSTSGKVPPKPSMNEMLKALKVYANKGDDDTFDAAYTLDICKKVESGVILNQNQIAGIEKTYYRFIESKQ